MVEALFDAVSEADESIEFTFKVTYVEIYMEKIRDLLDETRVKVSIVYSSFLYSSYSFFNIIITIIVEIVLIVYLAKASPIMYLFSISIW